MRQVVVAGAVAALTAVLSGGPAKAQDPARPATAAAAMAAFGLSGRLAVDCARPPGPDNATVVYAPRDDGAATRRLVRPDGAEGPTHVVSRARVVSTDRLEMREEQPDGGHIDVLVGKFAGLYRSVESRHSNGTYFVRGDKLVATGKPLPTFTRCGD